jgi:hypothetical protein
MRKRWGLAVAGWLAAAVVTTVLGVTAVNSIGDGILGGADRPFSTADVQSRLSAAPQDTTRPPTPSSSVVTAAPSTQPSPVSGVLATAGGTVIASCADGLASLSSWSPAQGYHADHIVPGPADTASIRFRTDSGKGRGARLSVTCPDGIPVGSDTDD